MTWPSFSLVQLNLTCIIRSIRMMDKHHIIHTRSDWTSRKEARLLRNIPELVPRIEREQHDAIHHYCPAVPLLGYFAISRTLSNFEPVTDDTLATMDNLMIAIEKSIRHPKAHAVERQLAMLTVHAIDLQRGYLR